MQFKDLEFTHVGCCGTHAWAEVRHESGVLTRIYQEDAGYSASTHAGQLLLRPQTPLADEAAVMAWLAQDAV